MKGRVKTLVINDFQKAHGLVEMLKPSHNWRSITTLIIAAFVLTSVTRAPVQAEKKVSIPSGPMLPASANETVSPEHLNVGDTVMSVSNDVIVHGLVLIRAGTGPGRPIDGGAELPGGHHPEQE